LSASVELTLIFQFAERNVMHLEASTLQICTKVAPDSFDSQLPFLLKNIEQIN